MAKATTAQIAEVISRGATSPRQIAGYLLSERRSRDLPAVMHQVMRLRAKQGIIEAEVTSAYALSSETSQTVRALLKKHYPTAQRFILTDKHDPEVTGGILVTTADLQLDLTVHGRLKQLKQLDLERK